MKIFFTACLSLASLVLFAQQNPIYKLYPDDIAFHLSFDKGDCIADFADGKPEPTELKEAPQFTDGLFGKAMCKGRAIFSAPGNMDMSKPGTIIIWIAPTWEQTMPANLKEPGFKFFEAYGSGKGYGYEFHIGKMFGQPWKQGFLNSYIQYTPSSFKHVNCLGGPARTEGWKKGEWRMIANTWQSGSYTISVNGGKRSAAILKNILNGPTKSFRIYCVGPIVVDEMVILNRVLSDEELAVVYKETMKAAGKQKE